MNTSFEIYMYDCISYHAWLQTFRNDLLIIFMFGLRVILDLITQFSKNDIFLLEKYPKIQS